MESQRKLEQILRIAQWGSESKGAAIAAAVLPEAREEIQRAAAAYDQSNKIGALGRGGGSVPTFGFHRAWFARATWNSIPQPFQLPRFASLREGGTPMLAGGLQALKRGRRNRDAIQENTMHCASSAQR